MKLVDLKDLYKEMMVFLESVENTANTIHGNLQEILVAQNYQDLTGQAIKKVTNTVTLLEQRLVELVTIAAKANDHLDLNLDLGGESEKEEGKEGGGEGSIVARNQDEVDDLLSNLGF